MKQSDQEDALDMALPDEDGLGDDYDRDEAHLSVFQVDSASITIRSRPTWHLLEALGWQKFVPCNRRQLAGFLAGGSKCCFSQSTKCFLAFMCAYRCVRGVCVCVRLSVCLCVCGYLSRGRSVPFSLSIYHIRSLSLSLRAFLWRE